MKPFTPLIKKKLSDLGVGIVYLFGSHAEEIAGPLSDVDLGVVMTSPRHLAGSSNDLYLMLFEIFGESVENSNKLDIVFLQQSPLELRFDVISHGHPLFEVSTAFRLDFEEKTMIDYCDFKPILQEFDQAILEVH